MSFKVDFAPLADKNKEEEQILEELKNRLGLKHAIRVCASTEQDNVVSAAKRLLEHQDYFKAAGIKLEGKTIFFAFSSDREKRLLNPVQLFCAAEKWLLESFLILPVCNGYYCHKSARVCFRWTLNVQWTYWCGSSRLPGQKAHRHSRRHTCLAADKRDPLSHDDAACVCLHWITHLQVLAWLLTTAMRSGSLASFPYLMTLGWRTWNPSCKHCSQPQAPYCTILENNRCTKVIPQSPQLLKWSNMQTYLCIQLATMAMVQILVTMAMALVLATLWCSLQ